VQHALFLPLFDELAEPSVVATLSAQAEQAGWDGVFVWDHLAYREPVVDVADPWITLAAIACATSKVRIGPMVTPLPRRRPVKLAREITSLDRLSHGRVTLGVGIGGDGAGELSSTGEQLDAVVRGAMLDEGLAVLAEAWTGEPMHHRGEHYLADGLTLRPTPLQRPGPSVWVAARYGNRKPLRRAARHDGVFPIGLPGADQLEEVLRGIGPVRPGYDVAVAGPPGTDPRPYADAGATWWLTSFPAYGLTRDAVRGTVLDGPPR
jgi:alkanesulfonate monooxygenase SsuD/methylene tetrahydromethanopterin reductase-like flavin-dependent oxidoreductase (luciferase family)